MACAITIGRKVPCKSAFGGIKRIYLAKYGSIDSVAVTAGTGLAALTLNSTPPVWLEYDVKGNSSLETTVTSSRENGTTFYTQTLNLTLTYLDALTQQELEIVARARPYVAVEDYYGNTFLCGFENGMEVTTGTIVTGAAAGDLSGFTLVFEGMEETAPYFLAPNSVSAGGSQIDPTA